MTCPHYNVKRIEFANDELGQGRGRFESEVVQYVWCEEIGEVIGGVTCEGDVEKCKLDKK